MTPKEKAIELVQKFNYDNKHFLMYDVRQCALICVDEILKGSRLFYIDDYTYWEEVKQEIQKL
jgi:hypothetical protein